MVHLTVVTTENVRQADDVFLCANYGCKLQASACVERQSYARHGLMAADYRLCLDCRQGDEIARRVGLTGHESRGAKRQKARSDTAAKKRARTIGWQAAKRREDKRS